MKEFYLIDSPSFEKLKDLKDEYNNLGITSGLLYLEIHKAYKNMTLAPSKLSEKIGSKKSTITVFLKGLEKNGSVKRIVGLATLN